MNILDYLFGFPVDGHNVESTLIPYVMIFFEGRWEFVEYNTISGNQTLNLNNTFLTISGMGGNTIDLSPLVPTCFPVPLDFDTQTNTLYANRNDTCETSVVLPTSGGGATTHDITANVTVGSVTSGDLIPAGTTLEQFIQMLVLTTYYPTYVAPTFSLTNSVGNAHEIGETVNLTLTYNFNRGNIMGRMVSGTWQPGTVQDFRAGLATNYTINGVDLNLINNITLTGYVLQATQTFSGTLDYAQGPQPKDSAGNNYQSPLPSGSNIQSTTITAGYPYYYGKVSGGGKPTENQALINSGTKVVAGSAGTITVNYNSAASDWLWFATPAASPTKTKRYVTALNNGDIGGGGNFFGSEVTVPITTVYRNGIPYKIYVSNYQSELTSPIEFRNA